VLVELSEKTQFTALKKKKLAPSFVSNLGWPEGEVKKSDRRKREEQALVDQFSRYTVAHSQARRLWVFNLRICMLWSQVLSRLCKFNHGLS